MLIILKEPRINFLMNVRKINQSPALLLLVQSNFQRCIPLVHTVDFDITEVQNSKPRKG